MKETEIWLDNNGYPVGTRYDANGKPITNSQAPSNEHILDNNGYPVGTRYDRAGRPIKDSHLDIYQQ